MANNKNRKLSGAVLTGALVTPAVMSAAQQNVASADFSGFLSSAKEWGSWALNGAKQVIKSAWSTTDGKIGLCTLAAVGFCGVVYLLDKLIPDDEDEFFDDDEDGFFDYEEISFSEEESKAFISFAKHFREILKKRSLSDSLIYLLAYLKETENTKDGSINLLIKNKENKLQTITVSKSACVRALKKTLDVFGMAANESPEELEKRFSEKLFGESFAGYLSEERVKVNGFVAGFQIPSSSTNATKQNEDNSNIQSKEMIIKSTASKDFDQNKTNENYYFDESYEGLEIEQYDDIEKDII